MIDHRIIDPRTPCRILYNSINSVTSKTNRRRSNNSLLPLLFETPIDSKNFFPLLLPRLKGFFDCVHACTHTTKRIISRWRIMIGRYNGINSLHRAESYIVRPWMNFFFEQIATLSPHEGSKREGERERERINPLALASNQRTKRVVDIYTISYIYIYVSFFRSKRRGWRGFSLKNSTRAERFFRTTRYRFSIGKVEEGRLFWQTKRYIYIYNRRKMNYPLEYLQWSKPCHSISSLKAACIHLRIWEKELSNNPTSSNISREASKVLQFIRYR